MSTKQFKTYCRIIDYLDQVNPDLAAITRATCADLAMGSLKGKPGITFLLPQDKAFLSKLEKLAYSDKTDEAIQAGYMINALTIRDVFKTPAEWKSREVANSLMPSQVVEVESTSAKEVVFKSGAKAVLDTAFRDASRRQNIAVWTLISGEIPVTTDKPAQQRSGKGKPKVGSYDPGNIQLQGERFKIALAVENTYAMCRLQREYSARSSVYRDVYVDSVLSLVNYIYNVRKDTSLLYERVLPLISLDKIDFYLLIEPHKSSGEYLLDDTLIHEWWLKRNSIPCYNENVLAIIENLLTAPAATSSPYLVYSDRKKLLSLIHSVRTSLGQTVDAKPRQCIDAIAQHYSELETSNTIKGVGPVYPESLAAYYKESAGLKFIQDELRYLTYGAFKRLETEGFDHGAFHELTNMIAECLYSGSEADRARNHKLLNKNILKVHISPSENVQEIKIFVYSTMLLYIPLTRAEANDLRVKYSITRPDPTYIVVFNISKDLYLQHNRLISAAGNNTSDIIAALQSLDVKSLDPVLRDEIQKKFNL
jgi:hypothetical protein